MFVYEKKLQYPVKIKNPNPKLAMAIISQYGGPDGELGASLRYLSQRYSMPYPELKGLLTDIGTEELGHLEMVGTIVHQLTRDLTPEQLKEGGFDTYFVDHTTGVFPQFASGYPWSASTMQVTGDTIADLTEDLAADAATVQGQHEKPADRCDPFPHQRTRALRAKSFTSAPPDSGICSSKEASAYERLCLQELL